MARNDLNTPGQVNGSQTPKPPKVFSEPETRLEQQLVNLLTLVNFLLLAVTIALLIKFSWMGLLAVMAVF